MARNGSGTYSRVNTFTAGATITAAGHNQNWQDLETEMTNSVAADGQTTMTGPLKAANGSAAAPSLAFGSDTDTGLYRSASNVIGAAVSGAAVLTVTSDGLVLESGKTFSGMAATPIGSVQDYAGSSAPTGWLLCYGQAVSRTTYASLFAVTGTAFGSGDGSTTFNVPDCRGRTSAGKDDMGGSDSGRLGSASFFGSAAQTVGGTGGAESVTLTSSEMPSHTHTLTDPGHFHSTLNSAGVLAGVATFSAGAGATGVPASPTDLASSSTGSKTTGISIANTGSGGAHNNVQPTIIFNKIIFTGVA